MSIATLHAKARRFAVLTAVCLGFGLAACGEGDEEGERGERAEALTSAPGAYTGTWELGHWAAVGARVNAETAPLTLTEDQTSGPHLIQQYLNVPSSAHWSFSFEARAVGGVGARAAYIQVMDAGNQSPTGLKATCTLTGAGSITSSGGTSTSEVEAAVQRTSDGWYACTVRGRLNVNAAAPTATQLRLIVYTMKAGTSSYQGDGTSGLEVRNTVLSGDLAPASCATKALPTCDFVKSLLPLREGFGAKATGGLGGDVYWVTNRNASGWGSLSFAAEDPTGKPFWIRFSPAFGEAPFALPSTIYVRSNRTIDGRDTKVTLTSRGLVIQGNSTGGASNVIVTSLNVRDMVSSEDDNISIANGAKDVWIHRCSLSGWGGDGLLDVSNGMFPSVTQSATDITISATRFSAHDKVMIINTYPTSPDPNNPNGEIIDAHSYDYAVRDSQARVTLHHNIFEGTMQRNPRAVFGQVHIYNNVLSEWSADGYGIGASFRAQALVENNVFTSSNSAGSRAILTQVGVDPEPGFVNAKGNRWSGTASGASSQPERVFTAPYAYHLDDAFGDLEARVRAQAGVEGPLPNSVPWQDVTSSFASSTSTSSTTQGATLSVDSSGTTSLIETATSGPHGLTKASTLPGAEVWAWSFDVTPKGTGTAARTIDATITDRDDPAAHVLSAHFVLSGNGSATATSGPRSSGAAASVFPLTGGAYRCVVLGTLNADKSTLVSFALGLRNGTSTSYLGNGTSGVSIQNSSVRQASWTPTADLSGWRPVTLNADTTFEATSTAASGGGQVVTETTANAYHQLNNYTRGLPPADAWRYSVDVLPRGNRNVRIYLMDDNNQSTNYLAGDFALTGTGSTSTWSGPGSSGGTATITRVGGRYRCVLSGLVNPSKTSAIRIAIDLMNGPNTVYAGDGTSGISMLPGKLEQLTAATATAAGFSAAQGTLSRSVDVLTFTESTANGQHQLSNYSTQPSAAARWRLSFDVAPQGARGAAVYLMDTNLQSTNHVATTLAFGAGTSPGTASAALSGASASDAEVILYPLAGAEGGNGGWYRCVLSGTLNLRGTNALRVAMNLLSGQSGTYAGDGTSGLRVRNVQLTRQ